MAFDGVLTPESASSAGGRLRFPGPWHTRTPRNASCTDFRLRDRRSCRLWGNRNGGSLSGRHSVGANRPAVTVRSARDDLDPDEVRGACNHRRSVGSARCACPPYGGWTPPLG